MIWSRFFAVTALALFLAFGGLTLRSTVARSRGDIRDDPRVAANESQRRRRCLRDRRARVRCERTEPRKRSSNDRLEPEGLLLAQRSDARDVGAAQLSVREWPHVRCCGVRSRCLGCYRVVEPSGDGAVCAGGLSSAGPRNQHSCCRASLRAARVLAESRMSQL